MMPESTVAQLQAWGRSELDGEDARRESELLLGHALRRERAWLFAHADDVVETQAARAFAALIERRRAGVPVAQLLGEWGFWTLRLQVTPDTLIPRPETELLVEAALARLPAAFSALSTGAAEGAVSAVARATGVPAVAPSMPSGGAAPGMTTATSFRGAVRIADLGTGTGAIALALASERPDARVLATDASADALAVARDNARRNGIANVEFRLGSWFAPLQGERFDLIASNPPYIADDDPHLTRGDLRFEPRSALASGADGLDAIREIARGAREHLVGGGWLLLEHGYGQGAAVRGLLGAGGLVEVGTLRDLEGRERVTVGRLG